ncbi:MAG: RHS repeat domain-containing protein [Spirosomataceae bacterium]
MKTTSLVSTLLLVLAGCASDDITQPLDDTLFIQEVSEQTSSKNLDTKSATTYRYTLQKQVQDIRVTFNSKFLTSPDQISTQSNESYTYDNNGFLTTKSYTETTENTTSTGKTTTQKQFDTQYSYQAGKLISQTKVERTIRPNGTTTLTINTTYEYDTAGKIAKQTIKRSDSYEETRTFSNGQLVAITAKSVSGNEGYKITNGLVERITYPDGRYATYEYDTLQRLVKSTVYDANGTINMYYTIEWANAKPHNLSLPLLKGHPDEQAVNGKQGIMAAYRFWGDVNGKMTQLNESLYTSQTNTQGFVTNTILKNQQFGLTASDPVEVINTTIVYKYQ